MTNILPKAYGWPKQARTFRMFIDDRFGNRMITGEWQSVAAFSRTVCDFAPKLIGDGNNIGFIACSSHWPEDKNAGDKKHYWHWQDGKWEGTMNDTPDPSAEIGDRHV